MLGSYEERTLSLQRKEGHEGQRRKESKVHRRQGRSQEAREASAPSATFHSETRGEGNEDPVWRRPAAESEEPWFCARLLEKYLVKHLRGLNKTESDPLENEL